MMLFKHFLALSSFQNAALIFALSSLLVFSGSYIIPENRSTAFIYQSDGVLLAYEANDLLEIYATKQKLEKSIGIYEATNRGREYGMAIGKALREGTDTDKAVGKVNKALDQGDLSKMTVNIGTDLKDIRARLHMKEFTSDTNLGAGFRTTVPAGERYYRLLGQIQSDNNPLYRLLIALAATCRSEEHTSELQSRL